MSIGTFVGFITLFGIVVRNCIMLIPHYRHLVGFDGQDWSTETLIRGTQEHLPAILMKSLVTAKAMLWIAIGSDIRASKSWDRWRPSSLAACTLRPL